MLQELSFPFWSHVGLIISLILSNSITLIYLDDPEGTVGTTYNSCWGISLNDFEVGLNNFIHNDLPGVGCLNLKDSPEVL